MARSRRTEHDSLGRNMPVSRASWGTVRKSGKNRFQARHTGPDGNLHNAPQTFQTEGAARAWLAVQREAVDRGTWVSPATLNAETLGPYALAWIEQRRSRKGEPLRGRTRESYLDATRRGLATLASVRLRDLTGARIRQWHFNRSAEAGATQAGHEARFLRAVLNTACQDGLIPACPVPSELCTSKTGMKYRPPTGEELAGLIEAMPARLRLAVQIAAFGGLRLSEWRALRRSDLTLLGECFVVTVSRQALRVGGKWEVTPPKSDEGDRAVTLPAWLTPHVTAHLADHVGPFPGDLLFPSGGSGEYIDIGWRNAWNRARRIVGVGGEVREHDLRHFYGTALAEAGVSAVQLRSAMGHASIQTSMIYVNAKRGASADVANLLKPPPAAAASKVVPLPTSGR